MFRLSSFIALAISLVVMPAFGQDYPTKTITLLVPYAAGGPTDIVARSLAQAMGKTLKQAIIVDNAVGAGGTIAPTKLKSANADGYTLMIAHIGMSTAPALYRSLPFKPLEDFALIGQVVDVPMTLVARKDMPAKDLKELIAYVKANKDKVTIANAGLGSASHLCGLLFLSAIQTELTTVPYKGTAPAMNDLLGGQVDLLCDQTTQTTSYITAGRVKAYGATSKTRVDSLKDLPTLDEAGLAGFEVVVWHGLYAPKGTPKAVTDKLQGALQTALADADFAQKMSGLGSQLVAKDKATPEGLHARVSQGCSHGSCATVWCWLPAWRPPCR